MPIYEPKRARKLTGFFFILGGAIFTSILLFFIVGFSLMTILGTRIPSGPIGDSFLIFSFVGGPIIGAIIGYILYKKSRYSKPSFYSAYDKDSNF